MYFFIFNTINYTKKFIIDEHTKLTVMNLIAHIICNIYILTKNNTVNYIKILISLIFQLCVYRLF
jgi:hypothetical protein